MGVAIGGTRHHHLSPVGSRVAGQELCPGPPAAQEGQMVAPPRPTGPSDAARGQSVDGFVRDAGGSRRPVV